MEQVTLNTPPVISNPPVISPNKPTVSAIKTEPNSKEKIKKKVLSILYVLLIIFSILVVLFFFFIFVPSKKIYAQIGKIRESVPVIKQAVNDKDLDKIKETLATIKTQEASIEASYKKLSWTKVLPVVGNYYKDGQQALIIAKEGIETGEILTQAIEPYKDFLGVKGGSANSEQTTEDRITFLTQSVEGLIPYLDQIEAKIATIQTAADQIDASRYPEEFKGYT
jgi:hypothetical protein